MATLPPAASQTADLGSGRSRAAHVSGCGAFIAATLSFATGLAYADSREKTEASKQVAQDEKPIIVEGTRPEIERRVYSFVAGITHRGYARESLALWVKPICPLVAGIPRGQGEFILEGVSQAAAAAGAPLADRDCRANFYIVVTSEPDTLVKLWRKRDHRLFFGTQPATIRSFLNTPGPIRVLYITEDACAYGAISGLLQGTDSNFGSWDTMSDCHIKDTRLEFNYVNGLAAVIVLVDPDHIRNISIGHLTDYFAMVGLAKLDLDADLGDAPTVLNMFADSANVEPQGMSAWDRAFLKATYDSSQRSRFQRSEITDRMVRDFVAR